MIPYLNIVFFPKITFPTRFSEHRGTLIDNFLCKLTNHFFEATAGIIVANISYHLPYFLCIGNVKAKYIVPKYRHIIQNTDDNKKAYNIMTELTNSKRNIRQAKILYYQHQFDQYKNNIKKTWGVIKELVNRTSMKNILPQYFIVDREVLTDKHVIANRLNTFFTNIGPKLASQIVTDGNSSYEDFLINPTLHEFNLNQIGEEDVVNVIDKLPSKTSSGLDGISTNLLKDITYIISKPLTLIINQCLETGIFPSKLKVAKVIPILKRGDETIFDNFRPISILPAISKVFERIIFNHIHNYFHVNDLYFCSQYGFRKEHSTELAVLELVDRINT